MENENKCPCCPRGCDLSAPSCHRGEAYARGGEVPDRDERYGEDHRHEGHRHEGGRHGHHRCHDGDSVDARLMQALRDAGHLLRFQSEGRGSQKRILALLLQGGKMTQRQLTELMGVQPGSASEVIGKLEAAGLLVRTPSETDRRTADVELTEQGIARAHEALSQRVEHQQEMFSCLSDDEKNELLTLLEKLSGDWHSRYGNPRHGGGHGCGHHGANHF